MGDLRRDRGSGRTHPVGGGQLATPERLSPRNAALGLARRIKFTTDDGGQAKGRKIAIIKADAVEYFGV
jgi:hypothetical protein